ncbi:N-acetylglutamate synthase-like GNAT family acetyltransferase [Pontibacter mucosus]|uniref:N-acetylglutamate synthase-like GNAT family acetyltransferase n=1 Tax=Pontibacter mucosus TaxID=1649266 RepID=A0A2T5Y3G3_9BACT|nr:GNAT family N-acetyltransferase [Pontibacter mucosus]PTX10664.1 N-acetylglutamate synthase-like GNAT family acetyltransferase [Pontibacter mucosus]
MQIRKGTEADIPAIVELLKSSLGEGLIQKSERLWNWKHVENPHGASPVLVAETDGQVVGVRAFLRWQWVYKGQVLQAIRAVDTATHPNFQGKGIFKKLTLKGLADAKESGIDLVYNTPNESSKPGYLKMGWIEMGQMALKLKVNPFAYKRHIVPEAPTKDWQKLAGLLPQLTNPVAGDGKVLTHLSSVYVQWRYQNNPLFDYYFLSDYKSYVLFYRIKPHSFGQEMRVVDLLIDEKAFDSKGKSALADSFKEISNSCFLTSASGRHFELTSGVYPGMGLLPVIDKGPIITLRNVNLQAEVFDELSRQNNWGYSLGDMELF